MGSKEDQTPRNQGRRFWHDKMLPSVAVVSTLAAVIALVVAWGSQSAANQAQDAVVALKDAEMAFCQRLQNLRDEVNNNGEALYRSQMLSAALLVRSGETRELAGVFRTLGRELNYQPATFCPRAVNDPKYVRPPSIRWYIVLGSAPDGLSPYPPGPLRRPR